METAYGGTQGNRKYGTRADGYGVFIISQRQCIGKKNYLCINKKNNIIKY